MTHPIAVNELVYNKVIARAKEKGLYPGEYLQWLFKQLSIKESFVDIESDLQTGHVYVLKDYNIPNTYKIGITTRSIQQRIKELNQSPGCAVKLEYLSPLTSRYKLIESKLHKVFKNQNTYSGQNLSLTEWFILPGDKYQLLRQLLEYEFLEPLVPTHIFKTQSDTTE
jgi:hypothetical protein